MSRVILKSLIFILLLGSFSLKGQIDANALKSAYLVKIANNFKWEKSDSILKIGILSNDEELFNQVKKYASDKLIDGKKITVEQILFPKKIPEYNILFVGKERRRNLANYLEIINKKQILLFSDQAPTMDFSMVNFYLSFDKKIKFKINSDLLKIHGLEVSNLMLILGGSDSDILALIEQKDSSLIKEKKKRNLLQKENSEKENQLKEMVSKIESISRTLDIKNEEIEEKTKAINQVNDKLISQRRNLSNVSQKVSETNYQLIAREKQIRIQEEKLNRQKKIFTEQKEEIESRNEKIKEQDEFLAQQKSMLNLKEKYLSYAYIFSLFLLGVLLFAIISFMGKRRSGAKLIRQNKKLQQALDDLQTAQAQLVQNEKMASLGMLTAGMAHEINNPMTFIYAGVNVLKSEVEELLEKGKTPSNEENIKQIIEDIELGSKRVTEIVKSLQNFSRLNEDDVKTIDLRDCVSSTLTILGSVARAKKIKINNHLGNQPLLLECFPASMNQVFVNIISNAIDAVKPNTGEVNITVELKNEKYLISVSDNGSGIDEVDLGKIFDPFFTTKDIGKGTGLGLSISYNIIKKHFGDITVKSKKGEGCTFTLKVPLTYQKS